MLIKSRYSSLVKISCLFVVMTIFLSTIFISVEATQGIYKGKKTHINQGMWDFWADVEEDNGLKIYELMYNNTQVIGGSDSYPEEGMCFPWIKKENTGEFLELAESKLRANPQHSPGIYLFQEPNGFTLMVEYTLDGINIDIVIHFMEVPTPTGPSGKIIVNTNIYFMNNDFESDYTVPIPVIFDVGPDNSDTKAEKFEGVWIPVSTEEKIPNQLPYDPTSSFPGDKIRFFDTYTKTEEIMGVVINTPKIGFASVQPEMVDRDIIEEGDYYILKYRWNNHDTSPDILQNDEDIGGGENLLFEYISTQHRDDSSSDNIFGFEILWQERVATT